MIHHSGQNNNESAFQEQAQEAAAQQDELENALPTSPSSTAWIHETLQNYVSNYTIHGLTLVFQGISIERVFWGICLIFAVIATFLISRGFFESYIDSEIVSEYKEEVAKKFVWPTITICDRSIGYEDPVYSWINCSSPLHEFKERCQMQSKRPVKINDEKVSNNINFMYGFLCSSHRPMVPIISPSPL